MNISHSSISRQISSLERFESITTKTWWVNIDQQGKILFKTAHDIFGKIAQLSLN